MPKDKKTTEKKTQPRQYIAIAHAEDKALAEDCLRLLSDNEIDAEMEPGKKRTYTIKVAKGRFNEAYIIIHSHLTPEGFFDIHTETIPIKTDPNQAA
jgi:hypothetical protein